MASSLRERAIFRSAELRPPSKIGMLMAPAMDQVWLWFSASWLASELSNPYPPWTVTAG